MSGGYFDGEQYRLENMAGDLDALILRNGPSNGYAFAPDVIEKFKRAANLLREAEVYVQRIDWLLSGDDGEDSFRRRLQSDLSQLRPYKLEEES